MAVLDIVQASSESLEVCAAIGQRVREWKFGFRYVLRVYNRLRCSLTAEHAFAGAFLRMI